MNTGSFLNKGQQVFYSFLGQDHQPCVTLVHGFCEDKSVWNDAMTFLADTGYRTIALDLPGFGNSDTSGERSIDHYADIVLQLLDHLEIQQTVLVGHSMGGYTALAFAEKQAHRLMGVGLFHSHAAPDTEDKKKGRLKSIDFIQQHGLSLYAKQTLPGFFAPDFLKNNENSVFFLTAKVSSHNPEGYIDALYAMMDRPDRTAVLRDATVPVLFVLGDADGIIPLDLGLEQTTLAPLTSLHILQGVGHMGMLEDPKKAAAILLEFADMAFSLQKNNEIL